MRTAWVLALALALAGCDGVDADTDSAKRVPFGDGAMAMAVGANLAEPKYLPEWAPMYPGARVTSKLVQYDAKGVIGRGTELQTNDNVDEVVAFYRAAASKSPVPLLAEPSPSGGRSVTTFIWPEVSGYGNSVMIHAPLKGSQDVKVAIAISTDR